MIDFIQQVSWLILDVRCRENGAKLNRKNIDDVMSRYISYEEKYKELLKNEEEMTTNGIVRDKNPKVTLIAVSQARDAAEVTAKAALEATVETVAEAINDHDKRTQAKLKQLCSSLQTDVAGLKYAVVLRYRVYPKWKHEVLVDDLCCLQAAVSRLRQKEKDIKEFTEEVQHLPM